MDIKTRLLNGNKEYISSISNNLEKKEYYSSLSKGQSPYALIICCSDSRVVPEEIFSAKAGELFVIRTAGNVINDGELASIEYGLEHLHIKYVLVLGHTHCGAIHASIHNEQGMYLDPILKRIKLNILDEKDELKASQLNALEVSKYIKSKFPEYKGEVESAIYDIDTNKATFIK